jgi:uncharacterized protein (DUF849 family)
VAVAPNGARRSKADHPQVPITAEEIAATARECMAAGAVMLHLHVRDVHGRHTLHADAYREAMIAIHDAVGDALVIQVSTEAVSRYKPAEQMALVRELRPEAVSLAIRELIPDAAAEKEAAAFLNWCRREGITTQYIIYDAPDARRFADLRARGIVQGAHPFRIFVLGRYASSTGAKPSELIPFLASDLEAGDPWMVCAFGVRELACAVTAAALGGHVRVGFENNLYLPDGSLAESNAELVAATVGAAKMIDRPLADADTLRAAMADWR